MDRFDNGFNTKKVPIQYQLYPYQRCLLCVFHASSTIIGISIPSWIPYQRCLLCMFHASSTIMRIYTVSDPLSTPSVVYVVYTQVYRLGFPINAVCCVCWLAYIEKVLDTSIIKKLSSFTLPLAMLSLLLMLEVQQALFLSYQSI